MSPELLISLHISTSFTQIFNSYLIATLRILSDPNNEDLAVTKDAIVCSSLLLKNRIDIIITALGITALYDSIGSHVLSSYIFLIYPLPHPSLHLS